MAENLGLRVRAGNGPVAVAPTGFCYHHRTNVTENGVPPSGNTRRVVGQSVAGRAPDVVRSKWRE